MDIAQRIQLPLSYRQEIVSPVMQCLLAGESCAIVGTAGTGKSNLLSFLARPDVCEAYLGNPHVEFLLFYVDLNRLPERSEWGFWELLLHTVVDALSEADVGSAWLTRATDLHQRAKDTRDELVAQRCFETTVKVLCGEPLWRPVLLLDGFDDVWRTLSNTVFLTLRGLRDEFKYRLSFVVATRDELSRSREGIEGCHDFYELVSLNTFGLGPHSDADARNQIDRFAIRRDESIPEERIEQLLDLSGRHPGILRAAYRAVADGGVSADGELADQLAQEFTVQKECEEIWNSLGQDERQALLALGSAPIGPTGSSDRDVHRLLHLKGLVNPDGTRPFCVVFEIYISQLSSAQPKRLELDEEKGAVTIDGKPIEGELTRYERALLSYLYGRRGEVCERKEIMNALYPDDEEWTDEDALFDRRLDTTVRRLRDKIEPDRKNPQFVVTVRDRGYKLAYDEAEQNPA